MPDTLDLSHPDHPDNVALLGSIPEDPTIPDLCGWVPNPEDVENRLASIPQPLFGDAAPHLAGSWDGKSDAPLWEACIKVTGANLPANKQTIGDCVGNGHSRGIDYLQCIQIANGHQNNEYIEGKTTAYTEALYGMMREDAHQLSNQDGASGIWAVHTLTTNGCPMRNGRSYDGRNSKLWGARGVPSEIRAEGKSQVLKQYIQVRTTKEAADLLSNGYPITVCSGQGFTMRRDQNGICEAQGSWAHCMLCIGFIMVNGSIIFIILQSWGQNVPSGPTIKNMPDNSFGARESIFQRMLNGRDSYALSGIPGFPSQELNFRI